MLRTQRKAHVLIGLIAFFIELQNIQANVVGTDVQNFNPITSGLDFVTVHSSETLKPGILNFGFFANYATNSLPRYDTTASDYSDGLLGTDLNFGIGLLPGWDAGISLPSVISQSVHNPSGLSGQYDSKGFTEIKLNTKYRFTGDDSQGIAAVLSTNINIIRNNPYVGDSPSPNLNIEIVGDKTFGRFATALNLGYRWRNSGTKLPTLPIEPYKSQYIASAATSYYVPEWDTKFILEAYGSTPATSRISSIDRQQSSMEALLGAKHDLTTTTAIHMGFARGLISGVASPDFRFYVGLNVATGPFFGQQKERALIPMKDSVETAESNADVFVSRSFHFDFGSAELNGDPNEVLGPLVETLNRSSFKKIVVEGHTDSVGRRAYNMKLSQARANTIKNVLVSRYKIPAAKVEAIGYGPDMPVADNGNYQGRAQNRRVEFKIDR